MWNNIYIPSFFLYNCFLKIHMFFQSAFSYWCHFWFFLKFSSQLLSFFRSHICFPSIEALMPFQHRWRFLLQLHSFFLQVFPLSSSYPFFLKIIFWEIHIFFQLLISFLIFSNIFLSCYHFSHAHVFSFQVSSLSSFFLRNHFLNNSYLF